MRYNELRTEHDGKAIYSDLNLGEWFLGVIGLSTEIGVH
jgi:hypothetical protein